MTTSNCGSDTDSSSNSSWTLIDENSDSDNNSKGKKNGKKSVKKNRKSKIELNRNSTIKIEENLNETEIVPSPNRISEIDGFLKITSSNSSVKNDLLGEKAENFSEDGEWKTHENGFLSFDEYLESRVLEHDYNFPSKSFFKSKFKKAKHICERKKCKAETIGILSICASLLTVTGIALLCLLFPESIDPKNFETIKSNYVAIVKNDSLDYNSIANNFTRTSEILELIRRTKLLDNCTNSILDQNGIVNVKSNSKLIGPQTASKSRSNRLPRSFGTPSVENVCFQKDNPNRFATMKFRKLLLNKPSCRINKEEQTGTKNFSISKKLLSLKSLLSNRNFKCVICTIVNDICMLKLAQYFNNPSLKQEKPKKIKSQKHPNAKLIRAIVETLSKIDLDQKMQKKFRTGKRKNKQSKVTVEEPTKEDKKTKNEVFFFTPKPTEEQAPTQVSVVPTSELSDNSISRRNSKQKKENGKSECERRFDEMDLRRKKAQAASTKHRDYINLIKDQYKSEIALIRDNVNEPCLRLKKIEETREKYRQNLKNNREKYLRAVRKMKQQRSKMMKDICSQKMIDKDLRDVSVGNYVVPIGENDDFKEKLKQIREIESKTVNNPISSLKIEQYHGASKNALQTNKMLHRINENQKNIKVGSAASCQLMQTNKGLIQKTQSHNFFPNSINLLPVPVSFSKSSDIPQVFSFSGQKNENKESTAVSIFKEKKVKRSLLDFMKKSRTDCTEIIEDENTRIVHNEDTDYYQRLVNKQVDQMNVRIYGSKSSNRMGALKVLDQ